LPIPAAPSTTTVPPAPATALAISSSTRDISVTRPCSGLTGGLSAHPAPTYEHICTSLPDNAVAGTLLGARFHGRLRAGFNVAGFCPDHAA
jgi:hypothetical protein